MSKYEYKLIKSRRKTYSIKVTAENEIIVRAPENASVRAVENILAEKRQWIERVMAFNRNNMLAADSVKNYRSAYVGGKLLPVMADRRNFIDSAGVHVTGMAGFKQAYIGSLGESFMTEFRAVESVTGLKSASVGFRSYKSMWGCCDGNCNIVFNFKLLMLPAAIRRYVMVHELCHTVHHDHSAAFWALVERFCPGAKKLRGELKKYVFLVKMY